MKRWLAEFFGTGLIVLAVVGSAFMATRLSDDELLQLLVNALVTVLILFLAISLFAPISGAHFNPVVTLVLALEGKVSWRSISTYFSAQFSGGFIGVLLANLMFADAMVEISTKNRSLTENYLGEIIATSVLVMIILVALAQDRSSTVAYLVPAWIGSAYFLTVSTSFANPAVTIARIFTSNFSGINITSAMIFIVCQLAGGLLGLGLARTLARK